MSEEALVQADEVPLVDPIPLVRSLHERLWVETGQQEEKCLYNVVEVLVFKLLSDLDALEGELSFAHLCDILAEAGDEAAMLHYARVSRPVVRSRFPTHSGGHEAKATVFVGADGEPYLALAWLFGDVIRAFQAHGEAHGSLRDAPRDLRARAYEAFLQQQAGMRFLTRDGSGQQLKWFPPTRMDRG
jgi:hypothetical protein